jgi:hypothetical protein
MENDSILDQGYDHLSTQGNLSAEDKDYLRTAAKWAKFLAIMGFISCGFMVLVALAMFSIGNQFDSLADSEISSPLSRIGGGMFGAYLGFFYLLLALPFFLTCLYLFRFASKMKASMNSSDLTATDAFLNLRNYFRFKGYIVIAFLIFYVLILVVSIGAAATYAR